MDDYIAKPVRAEVLTEVLDRWITVDADGSAAADPPIGAGENDAVEAGAGVVEPAPLDAERFDVMRELDGGDGALLRLVATEFLSDARHQVSVLREGVGEGDPEVVERAAHSLKGASAAIGALGLSELCSQLELLGRGRALGDAMVLVERVEHEVDRVRVALDDAVLTP